MAKIERVGDKFKIIVYGGYDESTGTQRKKKKTWTPTPELLRDRNKLEKELKRQEVLLQEECDNEVSSNGCIKLSAFCDIWFERYASRNLKPTSQDFYKVALARILPELGHIKLENLDRRHIDNFYINLEKHGTKQNIKYVFADNFKKYRKQNNIVNYKLAEESGVNKSTLERLARGETISKKSHDKLIKHIDKNLFKPVNEGEKLAQNSVRHHHRVLNSILQKAVKWGYMDVNPCTRVEPPKQERKEAAYLDDTQIQLLFELLENEPDQYRMMIQLLVFSGMRRGDEYVKQKLKKWHFFRKTYQPLCRKTLQGL